MCCVSFISLCEIQLYVGHMWQMVKCGPACRDAGLQFGVSRVRDKVRLVLGIGLVLGLAMMLGLV